MKQQLDISGIQKHFGKKMVLDNAGLSVETSDIVGLFGRNGCGKSTFLKILFGTEKAQEAVLKLNGNTTKSSTIIAEQIVGYLPQHNFVPMHLKLRNIVPMFLEDGEAQDKLFYSYDMHKLANVAAGKLSHGELRYFEFLLLAYSSHPFLLLDEPFSMVEPLYKTRIQEVLLELKKSKGIVITDHYYKDVLNVTTKQYILKDGKFIPVLNEDQLRENEYLPNKQIHE